MTKQKHFLTALLIILLIFGFSRPVVAQTGTVVAIDPDSLEVDPGGSFSMDVVVENVTDLYAFDVMISYDPDMIEFDHFEYGDFLEEGLSFTIPHDPGLVQCVLSQTSPAVPKTGSGILMTLYFVARELDGESDIILETADLSNIDGEVIPAEKGNGFVQVGEPKEGTEIYIPLMALNTGK